MTKLFEATQAAIKSIEMGNNGYADIGTDATVASTVRAQGYIVIYTKNLFGQYVYRGFTKAAQTALKSEPFGVSNYRA